MMQPCASAAKLRSGGPILFLGITAMAQTGTRHLDLKGIRINGSTWNTGAEFYAYMFGAIAAVATETPVDRDILQTFIRQLALDDSLPASLTICFLLIGMFAMALSAMSSMFSASLWVFRYDMLPALWPSLGPEQIKPGDEAIATRRTILVGCGLCLAAILLVAVADTLLGMSFTSSTFLAVLVACCCVQLSFVSLILAPIGLGARGMGAVSAPWALVIVGVAAACGNAAVIVYVATGAETWLWAAVPACLGSGIVLFAVARLSRGLSM
jgi:hypothetical protein